MTSESMGFRPLKTLPSGAIKCTLRKDDNIGGVLAVYRRLRLCMCHRNKRFMVRTAAVDQDTPINKTRCCHGLGPIHRAC